MKNQSPPLIITAVSYKAGDKTGMWRLNTFSFKITTPLAPF